MAAHSSILAWKIPWTAEPDRLLSMGLQRVGHNWVTSFHFRLFILHTNEKKGPLSSVPLPHSPLLLAMLPIDPALELLHPSLLIAVFWMHLSGFIFKVFALTVPSVWNVLPPHTCCAKLLQLCLTLFNSVDCSLPGSSVHGTFQARILEWVAISFSRGSSRSRNQTHTSYIACIGRQVLYH